MTDNFGRRRRKGGFKRGTVAGAALNAAANHRRYNAHPLHAHRKPLCPGHRGATKRATSASAKHVTEI